MNLIYRPEPWKHQRRGVELLTANEGFLLADDMGTGKSKTLIDFITSKRVRRTLIVCPKSVMDVWSREVDKHARILVVMALLNQSSTAGKADQFVRYFGPQVSEYEICILVVNYESVWREPLARTILAQKWDLVVCDESHRIKDPRSKVSKFIGEKLRKVARRRVNMTGTPFPHSRLDGWAQHRFLDPTIFGPSFARHRSEYAVMGGWIGPNGKPVEVVSWKNTEEFNRKFWSIGRRVEKKDVLDLPPKVFETRVVQLGKEARRIYDELETTYRTQVATGEITASNALVKLLRLQQVTSGFVPLPYSGPQKIDDAKAKGLKEIIEDLPLGEPIVVFCRFRYDLGVVHRTARELNVKSCELSGTKNELVFWQQDMNTILAVQIQSGSLGVDFTRAAYCVLYSTGFPSPGQLDQAFDRLHRSGQTRSVTYIRLVAQNTIDEVVYHALAERRSAIKEVLEGWRKQ